MKEDINQLEKEGYLIRFEVKEKTNKPKKYIYGRDPIDDDIEKMGLFKAFEGFKDVKPDYSGKHKASEPIENEKDKKNQKKRKVSKKPATIDQLNQLNK
mmetsp:Transcript_7472/g.6800  ORF Transcript_7472/g.6800 Transcript_7472/m.6800 type:complete len:99 (-) Transcript_7472:203-499(-)